MEHSLSEQHASRKMTNSRALRAFGLSPTDDPSDSCRMIRTGSNGCTLFTVGYERRSAEQVMDILKAAAVDLLVDVREKPISRKPGFSKRSLERHCEQAGIDYESWSELGSTKRQRDTLRDTGDLKEFHRRFRAHARHRRAGAIERLAKIAAAKAVALLCYERSHQECHRSTLADLVADQLDANVVAL